MSDDEDPSDHTFGLKSLSELTEEDIQKMGKTGLYISLNLSLIIYDCFMAGIPAKELHKSIDVLYEEISKQVKEGAN